MIDKTISKLSCNKEEFSKAKIIYENDLNESNFKVNLEP